MLSLILTLCIGLPILLVLSSIFYVAFFPPRWILDILKNAYGVDFYFNTNGKKIACLTIDDSPSSGTMELLDQLYQLNIKATFFIIGKNASVYPEILNRILRDGHEVGNHDIVDRRSSAVCEDILQSALHETHQILDFHLKSVAKELSDSSYGVKLQEKISWFRPGGGFFNKTVIKCYKQMRYRCMLGDAYPHDPALPFPAFSTWHMKLATKPGSVMILHDGSAQRAQGTIKVLQELIPFLKARGYSFCTLSQMANETEQQLTESDSLLPR